MRKGAALNPRWVRRGAYLIVAAPRGCSNDLYNSVAVDDVQRREENRIKHKVEPGGVLDEESEENNEITMIKGTRRQEGAYESRRSSVTEDKVGGVENEPKS